MKKMISVLSFAILFASWCAGAGVQSPARSADDQLKLAMAYKPGAERDNPKPVRAALDRGANIERRIGYWAPLAIAIMNDQPQIARLLIERGANIEAQDEDGRTPLHFAVQHARLEMVRLLLDRGANVNARASKSGATPICQIGNAQIVQLLLDHGAHADDRLPDADTALMAAANLGQADTIRLLLKHGARINDGTSWSGNAVMSTVSHLRTEALSALIESGADLDRHSGSNGSGSTPLILAAAGNKYLPDLTEDQYVRFITLLLDGGAAIDAVAVPDGQSALIAAAEKGRTGIIRLLLDHGANPDLADRKGNTALSLVTNLNLPEAIALINSSKVLHQKLEKTAWTSPQQQFDAYRDAWLQSPGNSIMREKLLRLAATLTPAPPATDEARQYLLLASQKMKAASTPDALLAPITLLRKATEVAPWWPNAYYNLSVALEMSDKFREAETQLNYYLLVKPDDAQARTRLKVIQTEKEAAAQAKP